MIMAPQKLLEPREVRFAQILIFCPILLTFVLVGPLVNESMSENKKFT